MLFLTLVADMFLASSILLLVLSNRLGFLFIKERISNPFVLQIELWQFCKTKTCNELNPFNYVYSSNYLPDKEILKTEILKSEYLTSTPYCIIV